MDGPSPLLTTKDCFPGISKYLLKSYVTWKVPTSGFGDRDEFRRTHVYTAILLTGLIGRTFPEALTPRAITLFEVSGELVSIRARRSPESSSIPESITTRVFRFNPVPIPIFPAFP